MGPGGQNLIFEIGDPARRSGGGLVWRRRGKGFFDEKVNFFDFYGPVNPGGIGDLVGLGRNSRGKSVMAQAGRHGWRCKFTGGLLGWSGVPGCGGLVVGRGTRARS